MAKKCPNCGSRLINERLQTTRFYYGAKGDPLRKRLSVILPVGACGICGFEWLDHRAEKIKGKAVKVYLKGVGAL
jgi:hypothetical protein